MIKSTSGINDGASQSIFTVADMRGSLHFCELHLTFGLATDVLVHRL